MTRTRLIQTIALSSMLVFSFAAFAEGAGCKSKEGHGKQGTSAESTHDFKSHHGWKFSEKAASGNNNASEEPAGKSGASDNVKPDKMLEI
ncbi:MAG TPA: hypothetical protein VIM41_11075 [Gammaproteobacteria bacterium]